MLQRINKNYLTKINEFLSDISNEEYLMYWSNSATALMCIEVDNDEWSKMQRISLNKKGELQGYMCAYISRTDYSVTGLSIVNLTKRWSYIFSKDANQFIDNLLHKYMFHKISFEVLVGNPAECIYDKLIKTFKGRIVGVELEHTKLYNNKYYDNKLYEILSEEIL